MGTRAAKGRKLFSLAALCVLVAAVLAPTPASASRTLPRASAPDLERLPALELAGADAAGQAELLPLYTFVDVVALDRVAGLGGDQVEAAVGRQRHRLHLVSSELARPGQLVWGSKTATGVSTWADADKHLEGSELSPKSHRPSFQGLWTDPVSGLSYARSRWYDARSASWLSEDPMGAVDSPNLYAFVGWGPHSATDPMGLESLGEMVHGYTEEAWAPDAPWWKRALAITAETAYATAEMASVGAISRIDKSQEAMERGDIDAWEYTAQVSGTVGRSAAVMAAGGLAGQGTARLAHAAGIGIKTTSTLAGVAGGVASKGAEDVIDIEVLETRDEYSEWQAYASAAAVGGAFGLAEGIRFEGTSRWERFIPDENAPSSGGGGRRGTSPTREHIDQVRDQFLDANPDYRHVAGGTDRVSGAPLPEEYLPGPMGGRKGSSYPDLTFEGPDGSRIRINTVDTRVDGSMTLREQTNFDRIFDQTSEPIIAIPKPD